jgi:hypothetical protein
MELVSFTIAINYPDGFKSGVIKIIHATVLSYLSTEAATTKFVVAKLYGAKVGNIVAGYVFATPLAFGL